MASSHPFRRGLWIAFVFALLAGPAQAEICIVPDAGGTADLPPAGPDCTTGYVSPTDFHMIVDGLPAGTTIEVDASHERFLNPVVGPGGNLGGEVEIFDSDLVLELTGTGALAGFNRTLFVSAPGVEVHTGPRLPGQHVQSFPNEMVHLQGELFGDPDFDLLRVTAGTANGLSSSGETTLVQKSTGEWQVDSFFDIEYRIEFQGAPGSALDGMGGITTDSVEVRMGDPIVEPLPCVVAPGPGGIVPLPPPCQSGQGYVSPTDLHMLINGLPAGTEIEIAPEHRGFFNIQSAPGGPLGGNLETFESEGSFVLTGTGALAGYNRTLTVPLFVESATAPQTPGAPQQVFPTEMLRIQGQLFGDPDFAQLDIRAGTLEGLPSPGETELTELPSGDFNVDSFFDIAYEIDFVGAPGGALDGLSGTTAGTVRMRAGVPASTLPQAAQDIPAVGVWGAGVLALGLGGVAAWRLRRRG